MSSGVTSGLAHGTTGSPQTQMENFEYASKLAQLQAEMENGKFTASQKSTLLSVSNTISDHLTEKDYSGVVRDLANDPIPKGNTGKHWDHIAEMKDAYNSLVRSKRSLEGSIKNPNLSMPERSILQEALNQVNYHINRINDLFEPYGGIEKWKKK